MKRFFDIVISAVAVCLLGIPLVFVIWQIRRKIGSPVFFRQLRPGQYGVPFVIFKFRTMTNAQDVKGRPLPDSCRITTFGRWMRATSLDEVPELWNVLRGEMSLVGPRPLLMEYLPLYSQEQARRHDMRPGITGWAQVNGRNSLSWDDKFKLDVWYVENHTMALDCKILWLTIRKVLIREGINSRGEATTAKFTGNRP